MSAYVVSKTHIDCLVATAQRGPVRAIEPGRHGSTRWYAGEGETIQEWQLLSRDAARMDPDELGAMLLAENVASVRYRYADSDPDQMVPTWILEEGYTFERPARQLTAVEAIKAADCYGYQSSEHPGWKGSEAQRFLDAFRGQMTGYLPGYDDAPWEITDAGVLGRVV